MELGTTVGLLVIGWLLGLLGPNIVNKITKGYQRKAIQKAMFSDLYELRAKMAVISYRIRLIKKINDFDRFNLLLSLTSEYKGFNQDNKLKEFIDSEIQLPIDQKQTDDLIEAFHIMKQGSVGTFFSKHSIPYIQASHDKLDLFEVDFTSTILSLSDDLNMYNLLVVKLDHWIDMTFDQSQPKENHVRIQYNYNDTLKLIMIRADVIIDKIEALFSTYK